MEIEVKTEKGEVAFRARLNEMYSSRLGGLITELAIEKPIPDTNLTPELAKTIGILKNTLIHNYRDVSFVTVPVEWR